MGAVSRLGQTWSVHGTASPSTSACLWQASAFRMHDQASALQHRFVKGLGADEAIDYTQQPFEDVLKARWLGGTHACAQSVPACWLGMRC